jgi:hypothetical protein
MMKTILRIVLITILVLILIAMLDPQPFPIWIFRP